MHGGPNAYRVPLRASSPSRGYENKIGLTNMHKALRHTLLQSTHYNIDCTLCHFSILLHFFPALTDLMGLPLPAGSQVKGWLHAPLRSAAGADIPRKLASQAASTLINGGKQGMIRLLAEQQIYPSQQLLHACDIIAAGSHKVTARLMQGGAHHTTYGQLQTTGSADSTVREQGHAYDTWPDTPVQTQIDPMATRWAVRASRYAARTYPSRM